MTKYYNDCDWKEINFFPVVVDSLGGWHTDAVATLSKLARHQASHTGREAEETSKPLSQRLDLLLMNGDAAMTWSTYKHQT